MSDAVLKYGEPENYVNRELSWLEFNYRILGEARDKTTPLFERLKFLSITASNLDEFFIPRGIPQGHGSRQLYEAGYCGYDGTGTAGCDRWKNA